MQSHDNSQDPPKMAPVRATEAFAALSPRLGAAGGQEFADHVQVAILGSKKQSRSASMSAPAPASRTMAIWRLNTSLHILGPAPSFAW